MIASLWESFEKLPFPEDPTKTGFQNILETRHLSPVGMATGEIVEEFFKGLHGKALARPNFPRRRASRAIVFIARDLLELAKDICGGAGNAVCRLAAGAGEGGEDHDDSVPPCGDGRR
ncbi:MAG: hypothetical protein QM278_06715 [Pseudomonadota bacterium]|nr:hypothetical protein [Pseudomonadota bacterium]